jgi:hypothetical protein
MIGSQLTPREAAALCHNNWLTISSVEGGNWGMESGKSRRAVFFAVGGLVICVASDWSAFAPIPGFPLRVQRIV